MALRIDCDSHFFPRDAFAEVDPSFADVGPTLRFDALGWPVLRYPAREANLIDVQRQFTSLFSRSPRMARPGFWHAGERLGFLDQHSTDMQVLVPSAEAFHYDVDPELGASVCRSYNNAMARVAKQYPGRFITLAHLPMQSPRLAIEELDRAINELGLTAPTIFSNVNGRNLDDPIFWDVYARVEELGVPLIVHSSRTGKLLGLERVSMFHLENSLGFMYEAMLVISGFICNGLLDMFPKLRIGLLESGSGYLPNLIERLNEVYEAEGVDKLIAKRPDQYLDQFWLSANVKTEQESLTHMVRLFGANRFMAASDYPHGLGGAGGSWVDHVAEVPGLTQDQRDRILGLNAAELFGVSTQVATAMAGRAAARA